MNPFNDEERLREAIENSQSRKEVLEKLGLVPNTSTYRNLRAAKERFDLELPKYDYGSQLKRTQVKRTDEEIFVQNSPYNNRTAIKRRLYESGVEEKCSDCGIGPEWNGKPLTLQLDHINGVWNDNRRENLRILCPNCHAQTETFSGKAKEKKQSEKYYCSCGNQKKTKASKRCNVCATVERYGIKYPPYGELKKLVKQIGYSAAGRKIGCSDVAVRKHLEKLEREMSV